MLAAMPQRTAFTRWMEPTPAMAPVITCVVETATFMYVASRMDAAAAASARRSRCAGLSRVRRAPMV